MATSSAAQPEGPVADGLEAAFDVLSGRRIAILTGAGISTDSGIPDYRGEGSPSRTPMTFQQFLGDETKRKRYWAGSHAGWRYFSSAEPNDGHRAVAALETAGLVTGVVTQNVDGLHLRAGSRRVVDLHGSVDRVLCLSCDQVFSRTSIAERMIADNPELARPDAVTIAPDGDAIVDDIDAFRIPACTVCGGILKPDVVFFGEYVPAQRFSDARAIVRAADALLVAGSSLVVNSGVRLVEEARRGRSPIVIVNRGVTKGDRRAAVKIDGGATENLLALAQRLGALPGDASARVGG